MKYEIKPNELKSIEVFDDFIRLTYKDNCIKDFEIVV